MKYYVQLYNSFDCVLDTITVHVLEGRDHEQTIKQAVLDLVHQSVLCPGDNIRITEAL